MLEICTTLILFKNYYHWLSGLGLTLRAIILIHTVREKHQLLGLLEVVSHYTVHTNMKGNYIHSSEDYFNAQDLMDPTQKRSLKHKEH